jgi:phosphomannomutase
MNIDESIFRAYDIRGIYPTQINQEIAYSIAQAYAGLLDPKTVAVGRDIRLSGKPMLDAVIQALVDYGVNVVDIGVVTTEMLYFAVAQYGFDGGITISASHNTSEYTGLKLTGAQAIPVSGNSGLEGIKQMVLAGYSHKSDILGTVSEGDITEEYLKKCLSFVEIPKIKPMKVVANAMNGLALANVKKLNLPVEFVFLNDVPDGNFPKGQPNPLLPEQQKETIATIQSVKPDFGVAWDGDADRFFIFDENGKFIPPYYLMAFLTRYFCTKYPGAKVVHDLRLVWAIEDEAQKLGGTSIRSKAGYPFVRQLMRENEAVLGCETSGHTFFRDFYYTDNGIIPFLIMLEAISESGKKVSELFDDYFDNYPISGEINTKVASQDEVQPLLEKLEQHFAADSTANIDKTDGITIEYPTWRANIRGSNTEPFIRTNVEARSRKILNQAIEEVLKFIG